MGKKICFFVNGNKLCEVTGVKISKLYNNYYIVTKYGSMIYPYIVYKKVSNGLPDKDKHISDYFELVNFIKANKDEYIFLRGFSRGMVGTILGLVLDDKSNKIVEKELCPDKKTSVRTRGRKK